jgi:hypothetical protein
MFLLAPRPIAITLFLSKYSDSSQVAQLVQAMAGFGGGGGAAESLNTVTPGTDTSQQPLLTTPQHA